MAKDTTLNRGNWVKLHREMFDNPLWLSEKFTKAQAWIDLFGNARHTAGSFWIRGNEIKLKRGQLGWSELTMSKRWGWSRQKVRGFLATLEHNGQIGQQKLYKLTSITTILNYDKYQNNTTNLTTERQQKDNRPYTNKKVKKEKKEKNVISKETLPPKVVKKLYHPSKETLPLGSKETLPNNNNTNNKYNNTSCEHRSQRADQHIINIIDAFKEFGVNKLVKSWYGNKSQRGACEELAQVYGEEQVIKVVQILSKSNNIKFIPTATTPCQLRDRWSAIEAGLRKIKQKTGRAGTEVIR